MFEYSTLCEAWQERGACTHKLAHHLLITPTKKTKLKDDEQNYEKLKEEILNKQIAALEKLKKDEAFRLFSKLERKHGDYLPLHAAYLRNIDGISLKRVLLPAVSSLSAGSVLETHVLSLELDREGARREPERLKEVLNICDKIIEKVDQSGLAAFYGIKQPVDNSESRRLKKEKDETEAIFVEALIRKAYALLEFEDLGCEVRSTVERREELMKLLNQWCSAKSPQHEASQLLNAEVELRRGQYGLAMKTMDGIYQELTDRDLRAKATAWKVCTLHRAGWLHCSHVEAGMYYAQFPATVPLMY
ncbi:uncharacterized protein LOC135146364 [Zophobas morio]|uniref:uncharacterized protein LOC135146364 n=1 Tax=Zophobas morio TaxID=2755281 RepID=UPI003083A051